MSSTESVVSACFSVSGWQCPLTVDVMHEQKTRSAEITSGDFGSHVGIHSPVNWTILAVASSSRVREERVAESVRERLECSGVRHARRYKCALRARRRQLRPRASRARAGTRAPEQYRLRR
jgi:hypothetical protein